MMKQIHLYLKKKKKIDSQPIWVLTGHSCIEDKRLRKDKGQGLCNVGKKKCNFFRKRKGKSNGY